MNRPMLKTETRSSQRNTATDGANSAPATPSPALNRLEDGTSLYLVKKIVEGISTTRYNISNTK